MPDAPARHIASKKGVPYNQEQGSDSSLTLIDCRDFLKLPMDLRRSLLRKQAKRMVNYYQYDSEWRELETGNLVEYEFT